ncbi:MAG: hypothetical protein ACTHU0_17645 [Kofleriaceae bacterium]
MSTSIEQPGTGDAAGAIPQVAASEHDLIAMARALIAGPSSQENVWALLCAARPVATEIGPSCAVLLEDALRHAWHALWLRGAARPIASLAGGAPVRGRLWERHAPAPLAFTTATLRLLRWLVSTSFAAPPSSLPALEAMPLALGDQLMIYLALDAAQRTPALGPIANQPFVRAAPLAWLGFAHALGRTGAQPPSFDSLVDGVGAILVECLTGELAARWRTVELSKRAVTEPGALLDLGAAQDAVLTAFQAACDARHRRDLALFVIDATTPLVARDLAPVPAQLDPGAPLSQRSQARVAAGALARAVLRWADWDQQHRAVRFIDDDYAAAQLLLERFEAIGSSGSERVARWLSELASLVPTQPQSDTISAE